MKFSDAKLIINEKPNLVNKFRVHFTHTDSSTPDFFPAIKEQGLNLKRAQKLAREFYHSSHGRFTNIEVKRDI